MLKSVALFVALYLQFASAALVSTFVPECSCSCCTVQICDASKGSTSLCTGTEKPSCMLDTRDKVPECKTWVDPNFIPFKCNPASAWTKALKKGNAPADMNHNQFCSVFCHGKTSDVKISDTCIDNPPDVVADEKKCCPCAAATSFLETAMRKKEKCCACKKA